MQDMDSKHGATTVQSSDGQQFELMKQSLKQQNKSALLESFDTP